MLAQRILCASDARNCINTHSETSVVYNAEAVDRAGSREPVWLVYDSFCLFVLCFGFVWDVLLKHRRQEYSEVAGPSTGTL